MVDMTQTIAAKSDQLNADDLIGKTMTITVAGVKANVESAEQPVSVFFQGDNGKPYRPCKSMRRVMVHCWGPDAHQYVGKSMTLFRDPDVQFGGMKVGGIRISHMSHIDGTKQMALSAARGAKKLYKVNALRDVPKPSAEDDAALRRSNAENWVDGYIKALAQVGDAAAFSALEEKSARAVSRLRADFADLYEMAIDAGTKRAAELRGSSAPQTDDVDPFATEAA